MRSMLLQAFGLRWYIYNKYTNIYSNITSGPWWRPRPGMTGPPGGREQELWSPEHPSLSLITSLLSGAHRVTVFCLLTNEAEIICVFYAIFMNGCAGCSSDSVQVGDHWDHWQCSGNTRQDVTLGRVRQSGAATNMAGRHDTPEAATLHTPYHRIEILMQFFSPK